MGKNRSKQLNEEQNKEEIDTNFHDKTYNQQHKRHAVFVCIIGILAGITIEYLNRLKIDNQKDIIEKRKYWVYSDYNDVDSTTGLLKHVHLVLKRCGYEKNTNKSNWNLLWSHDYPFRKLYPNLHKLKQHQKVNHFPATGFITNKVDLAISDSKYIPKAFKLPENKEQFLEYAKFNKNSMFLEKHNQHRGVALKNVSDIDATSGESFVQEYVQRPFLVDGHKFDIGVYIVLTSVNPLRVYWYKGDVLFRYCPAKYYPFEPTNLDKYVVADDYLPTWEVPSLAHPYTALGFSMKDAFDIYVRSQGKDPAFIWSQVEDAIAEVFLMKEHHIVQALKNYPPGDNFFELMRVDLVIDEDLKVYLLEANMSPNLSSAHFPPNQLLYEQVLYNLFKITGIASYLNNVQPDTASKDMISAQKNIAVWGNQCSTLCRDHCEGHNDVCGVCKPCINSRLRSSLLKAHYEFLHRGDFRRVFPPRMEQGLDYTKVTSKSTTLQNKLQLMWYQGKCNDDVTWCS